MYITLDREYVTFLIHLLINESKKLISFFILYKNYCMKHNINTMSDKMNALEKLVKFMDNVRCSDKSDKERWTHKMTHIPYGHYCISDDTEEDFYNLYTDCIASGFKPHIMERYKEHGPIIIDINLVQDSKHRDRMYTDITIVNMVKIYNLTIKKFVNVTNGNNMISYILEKKAPTLHNNKYYDGFQIIYPNICTTLKLQLLIRDEVIYTVKKNQVFKKIPLIVNVDQVFNKISMNEEGWLMYGSIRNTTWPVYCVTHIYDAFGNKKLQDRILPGALNFTRDTIYHLVKNLRCGKFNDTDIMPMTNIDNINDRIDKIVDTIVNDPEGNDNNLNAILGHNNPVITLSNDDLARARTLVTLLSPSRVTNKLQWYQLGNCLFNIDHRLRDDWIVYSKRCDLGYDVDKCISAWKKMKRTNYAIATLHYFASQDNPEAYTKLHHEKMVALLKYGLEGSHNTIAKVLIEKYKFMYKCAGVKNNLWYQFRGHRWKEIDSAYTLRNLISDELTIDYSKLQTSLYEMANKLDGYEKERCHAEAQNVRKVIAKLNNNTFKTSVIRECADIAYDPEFSKKLDENIYLIGFNNGIYDLENDCFRDGNPDDYVSFSTGYDYIPYDSNDRNVDEINDFMEKIQTDRVMREYLLTLLSTCLTGSVSEESFYIFTGSGANGKSKLMELVKHTMGDYYKPMDVRLITGARGTSSQASPDVADKKGIRVTPFDEPNADDEINTGFMKLFTGGDTIPARALFRDPIYFKPQFKPFLLCNKTPKIDSADEATWRRVKVIPFESKFYKRKSNNDTFVPDPSKKQFWADMSLPEKLVEWKQMFMAILIQYYRIYKKDGLVHPDLVTEHTTAYQQRNDIFRDFINSTFVRTDDPNDTVSLKNIQTYIRAWSRNENIKCPTSKDLRAYLSKMSDYDVNSDKLIGYKCKPQDDAEDEQ